MLGRPRRSSHRRFVPAWRPTDQPGGVRDVIVAIGPHNEAIKLLTRHARPAHARLKVVCERCGRDE